MRLRLYPVSHAGPIWSRCCLTSRYLPLDLLARGVFAAGSSPVFNLEHVGNEGKSNTSMTMLMPGAIRNLSVEFPQVVQSRGKKSCLSLFLARPSAL
jgi:hypothetical protein